MTQAQGRRRLTRSQIRKIALIIILILLLAMVGAYYAYYQATHKLTFNIAPVSEDVIDPPQFLYAFSGTSLKLQRPIGVMIDGDDVYVPDSTGRQVLVFSQAGRFKRSFGASQTVIPLNIAKNPKSNELYVTDRRQRTIFRYDLSGKYLGEFLPNLPPDQLPTFKTGGVQWAPVALAFAADGTLYVTEILNGHRMLIFGPDGKFKKSVGNLGQVEDAKLRPGLFQFPNGITLHKGLVYVTDSNNRRVQIFDKDGTFKKIIVTDGLPRGIAFLNRFPFDKATAADRMVVVDTLAHDGTSVDGQGRQDPGLRPAGVRRRRVQLPQRCGDRNAKQDLHRRHLQRPHPGLGLAQPGLPDTDSAARPTTGRSVWPRCCSCRCSCCSGARSSSPRRTSCSRWSSTSRLTSCGAAAGSGW